jgi:hypothetical protein
MARTALRSSRGSGCSSRGRRPFNVPELWLYPCGRRGTLWRLRPYKLSRDGRPAPAGRIVASSSASVRRGPLRYLGPHSRGQDSGSGEAGAHEPRAGRCPPRGLPEDPAGPPMSRPASCGHLAGAPLPTRRAASCRDQRGAAAAAGHAGAADRRPGARGRRAGACRPSQPGARVAAAGGLLSDGRVHLGRGSLFRCWRDPTSPQPLAVDIRCVARSVRRCPVVSRNGNGRLKAVCRRA